MSSALGAVPFTLQTASTSPSRSSTAMTLFGDDTAVVTGGGRHYILVALTEHAKGDAYLEALAGRVDALMVRKSN